VVEGVGQTRSNFRRNIPAAIGALSKCRKDDTPHRISDPLCPLWTYAPDIKQRETIYDGRVAFYKIQFGGRVILRLLANYITQWLATIYARGANRRRRIAKKPFFSWGGEWDAGTNVRFPDVGE